MNITGSLANWLGQAITLRTPKFWAAWGGGANWAGKTVTEINSMNLSAWFRGVRLYGDVTGALPNKFYKKLANGDREEVDDHRVATMLVDPNPEQTGQEFWGSMATDMAVFGNSYAEKGLIGNRTVRLDKLDYNTRPDRTRHSDRRLEYIYYDRGKYEYLPPSKVFHVKGFTWGKSDVGLSPLEAARQSLSLTLATEEAAGKTFSQGLRMSGFFSGPRLDPEQRKDFKERFIDPILGNDASAHYGVLEKGFEFKPVNIPPKDAEMLLSRRFNVEDIARFMGLPPIMVGHNAEGQTAWGTGVESIINMWLTLGYNSFLRYFETSINKWLLLPEERGTYYSEYTRNALLRMDSAARSEFMAKMIQNGLLTPNEGRRTDNRMPLEGGDQGFVNSTMVPLKDAGKKPPAKVQPAPGDPIPE